MVLSKTAGQTLKYLENGIEIIQQMKAHQIYNSDYEESSAAATRYLHRFSRPCNNTKASINVQLDSFLQIECEDFEKMSLLNSNPSIVF